MKYIWYFFGLVMLIIFTTQSIISLNFSALIKKGTHMSNKPNVKKITKKSMTKLAFRFMEYFHKHEMWHSTIIYASGKRYLTPDYMYGKDCAFREYKGIRYAEEIVDVKNYITYSNPDTITISFEGMLYDIIDNDFDYILKLDKKFLEPYGLYFELGDQWNMSAYEG